MPIDYTNYPKNWKSKIRPEILERAHHKCECCGVENYKAIFRGFMNIEGKKTEIYQTFEGYIHNASDSKYLFTDTCADIVPLGKEEAIKVVLTIAHLDHNVENNGYSNLKAMCQRCHLRYDKHHHIKNRKANKRKKQGLIELF
jgi:predicted amidophosphoribosyltransferase